MSDHVPLLFVPDVLDTDFPKAFRFKNFWIMGEAFFNVVSRARGQDVSGSPMFRAMAKLRQVKWDLKEWHRGKYD